jgi:hypothetical protein
LDGHGVLEADLGVDVVLVGDDDAGLGDVLEPDVLAPQPVAVAAIDLDPHGRVAHGHIDQGQAGLVLADRRVALALEGRVQQHEAPGRRGLLGQDAVAPALEVQVLGLVGDLVQARQARADVELHVAEKACWAAWKRIAVAAGLPLPILKSMLLIAE